MNGAGRLAVSGVVDPSDVAILSQSRVLLRDGDLTNDGTTIGLPFAGTPAINGGGDIVTGADNGIVTRNEVVFGASSELPDRAVIELRQRFGRPVIDWRASWPSRAIVEHEDR